MIARLEFTKEDTLAMKGVAIIIMLFHHCFLERDRYAGITVDFAPFTENIILYFAAFGKVCVGIFVFLSAYGMTMSLKKSDENNTFSARQIYRFIARRLWHLLTGFWPAFLLCLVGSVLLSPGGISVYGEGMQRFAYMFLDAMGLARLMDSPTLMGTWWYMSLAIIQIFLMPLLVKAYYKYGVMWLIALSMFLPIALKFKLTDTTRWAAIMVLGIWCADKNIFAVLRIRRTAEEKIIQNYIAKFIIASAFMCIAIIGKNSEIGKAYPAIFDFISAAAVLMFGTLFVIDIPGLRRILVILGTYSMNIFLIHSFIRVRWFHEFTYSFKYWWLILIVLLADSFLAAAMLEGLKKLLKYQKLVEWGEKKIVKELSDNGCKN